MLSRDKTAGQPGTSTDVLLWWGIIGLLITVISVFHYATPTSKVHFHLIYMQSYYIPILIGAFQFGKRGGFGAALVISAIYFPHIVIDWGGSTEQTLMRVLQVLMFNVVGYLTGLKAEQEHLEKVKFRKTARQLEQSLIELRQQSEKLSEMEQQLRLLDRLSIVGELTASLAHEVRNPLGAIRGAAEILRDELPRDHHTREFLNILIQETQRLSATVENYLGFTGRQQIHKARFDVRETLQNVAALLNTQARRQNIRLELQLPDAPLWIEADTNQLRQVLANLILNAIQAMPRGGAITLSATRLPPAKHQNDQTEQVVISVKDQGSGMEPEVLEKIFTPFYTTRPQGTGLGLSIVRRIVEENRWHISVDSTPGKGSEFRIAIPILSGEQEKVAEQIHSKPSKP
ncbi:MAG: sensor histidine kinase [Calditrichaeota bacterium]|nr:MAG: sensor histidine kinase [Calditrichota bacterium]